MQARRPELLVALVILASTLLVWPFGDYLVDDDWAYTRSLSILAEEGRLQILGWNPMTLVVHLAWGWLFTSVLGFSFSAAKLSTVALLLVECLALISILRHMGARESTLAMAALALLFCPVHFFQSFLYATDVPTLAWTTLSLLFYLRGLAGARGPSHRDLVLGSLFCALAFGVRQGGILVAAALFLHLLVFERVRLREPRTWLACFGVPLVAAAALQLWYHGVHGPTRAYLDSLERIFGYLENVGPAQVAYVVYTLFAYLALPLLPLVVALPFSGWLPRFESGAVARRAGPAIVGAAILLFAWMTFVRERPFPYLHNKITRFGFLSPNELIVGAREVLWGPELAWGLSVALLVAGAVFVLRWSAAPQGEAAEADSQVFRTAAFRLLSLYLALVLGYSALTFGIVFDRHLLVLAPPALLLLAGGLDPLESFRPVRFALCLLPLAFYDIAATHDVHAFSRAAFAAGRDLVEQGVDVSDIDAGYAFDGWHMYERSWADDSEHPTLRRARHSRDGGTDPWYVHGVTPGVRTKYMISLSRRMEFARWREGQPWWSHLFGRPRLQAYRVLDQRSYRSYWPWRRSPLYVLVDRRLEDRRVAPGELRRDAPDEDLRQ